MLKTNKNGKVTMRILSLDPSTVNTGWAIIDCLNEGKNVELSRYGVIEPFDDLSQIEKYFYIANQVSLLIALFRPDELVIENTFYSKNARVLKKLNRLAGQILYVWYKMKHKEPHFYMAVSARGSIPLLKGNSTKEEVVSAVNYFFKLRGKLKDHNSADAIVVGYHHVSALYPVVVMASVKELTKKDRKKVSDSQEKPCQS